MPPLTRAGRPVRPCAAVRARSASAGSTGVRRAMAAGAAVLGRLLGGADREAVLGDLPRQPPARVVVGQRQHGPGVALGELAAGEHPEHVLGQLEQAHAVRDGRLRAADPLGDLAERELELVDQGRVGARLLDRREVLAGDVLDEAEQQRVAVVRVAARRPGSSARPPRGPHASGARRRSARSRPRAAGARRPAAGRPGAGSRPRGPRSPRARSGGAAGAGSAWTASTGRWSSSASPAPPISTSRPRPRPRRGVSLTLDKFHRHLPVGLRAGRAAVVGDCGQPVARRLGEAHRARHGRA